MNQVNRQAALLRGARFHRPARPACTVVKAVREEREAAQAQANNVQDELFGGFAMLNPEPSRG